MIAEEQKPDLSALTVGSAMVDVIVIVADNDVERMTMHNDALSFLLLEQGSKIEAVSITDHCGGGAINAAVSFSRLGLKTSSLIKVGDDADGERITNHLANEGINLCTVKKTTELPTGRSVMVSSHDKNATIFTQRGANTLLVPEDLRPDAFNGIDLLYVTNLSNKSADCFPETIANGKSANSFVAVNPGIRQLTSRTSAFMECLNSIDFLAMNRKEAEALVPTLVAMVDQNACSSEKEADQPRLWRVGLDFGGFSMSLSVFFQVIRTLGVGNVAVTDGSDGSYLSTNDGIFFCPAFDADVQGTAGAGDAFSSTLCACLLHSYSPLDALAYASANAASVVSSIDAQTGLLSEQKLNQVTKRKAEIQRGIQLA